MRLRILTVFTAMCVQTAFAQDTGENGWVARGFTIDVDELDRDKEIDYSFDGIMVHTSGSETPGIVFSCSQRHGIGATVASRAMDLEAALQMQDTRPRLRTVRLKIGDGEESVGRWLFLHSIGTVEPTSAVTRREIYNAAILGQTLSLRMSGRADWTVQFPQIDEAFRAFHRHCHITNPDGD